jgi:pimeloyl-ACP methyl ester carboxylesterase
MPMTVRTLLGAAALYLLTAGCTTAADNASSANLTFVGAPCSPPPILRCSGADCGAVVTEQGPVKEPTTGRNYFLDYPCDLKVGEKVTVVLSLHGGGSFGNWQRHYFPLVDYVEKYRLVVITPNAPPRVWKAEADDAYLETLTRSVVDQIGARNVKALWLAGHSQGGITARRLVCSSFFRDRADGYLSISASRVGGSPGFGPTGFGPAVQVQTPSPDVVNSPSKPTVAPLPDPDCDFSHIAVSGEHEIAKIPDTSTWADKYDCTKRVRRPDIVDVKGGHVSDTSRQNPPTYSWGRAARPGTAEEFEYVGCRDGRVVADIVRLDKGHTEGWEPKVTETIVQLMVKAKGGKIAGRAG